MRAFLSALVLSLTLLFVQPAASMTQPSRTQSSTAWVIRHVFHSYGDQALRVAWCESRLSIWASNGQYLGLFQMGSHERARYGHGWNAWAQTRAAYHYFVDSGRDWSPWSCKP